jgi:hypothetical protein
MMHVLWRAYGIISFQLNRTQRKEIKIKDVTNQASKPGRLVYKRTGFIRKALLHSCQLINLSTFYLTSLPISLF